MPSKDMTARERALAIFRYEDTDKVCFDLMESRVWDSIGNYFCVEQGLETDEDVREFLDCDFRWSQEFGDAKPLPRTKEEIVGLSHKNYSDSQGGYLLGDVTSVAEVDKLFNPDPYEREMPDFRAMREKYPDKALVFCVSWTPFFSGACSVFGMEKAMMTMALEPELYHAFAIKQKEYQCEYVRLAMEAGVAEYCDFFWGGDDFAAESGLLLSPDLWRSLIKPYWKEVFDIPKSKGMNTLFHSCGAVSEVYPDFIEIGIDSHIGVQTSAKGMDIERLAKDFGGDIVIFGGVDAQTTLVQGTMESVEREVKRNIDAFADCGGYIVSNSHFGLPDIPGENLVAMAQGAGRI